MKEALMWWNNLSFEERFYKVIPWLKAQKCNVTDKHPSTLTDEEILKVYEFNQHIPTNTGS